MAARSLLAVVARGVVTPVDSLKTLRYDAGLSVSVEDNCPEIASTVTITES